MQVIKFISLHHYGGTVTNLYQSSQKMTLEQLNEYHQSRWPDFPSTIKMPDGNLCFIGYNICILPNGTWFQSRIIGEEGAHTKGHNLTTIGIVLAGNFLVDKPTLEQMTTLKTLLLAFIYNNSNYYQYLGIKIKDGTIIDISASRIWPHRYFSSTSCNCLPDSWGRDLLNEHFKLNAFQKLYTTLTQLLLSLTRVRKFGYANTECGAEKD